LIHRDVKPQNMLINADGRLKLMDLGLAKDMFDTEHSLTITGMVVGSPNYISPEQIRDPKTVDFRTDLYSLGISFYQMLTAKAPFERTSAAAVCAAHLQDPMPSVGLADAELTAELDHFIARLTEKNREARYQSAAEVLAGILPWLERRPIDNASRAYLAAAPFHERAVGQLLKAEGIEPEQVDANLTPVPRGELTSLLNGTGSDTTVVTDDTAPMPKRRPWLWLVGGILLGAALVGGTVFAMFKVVVAPLVAQMKARAKPAPPSPGDVAVWLQQRRVFAEQLFAETRHCPESEWLAKKKQLLDKIRDNLQQQWRIQDPAVLDRIVANNANLLEEVRAMTTAEFQRAKPRLLDRWLLQGRKPGERPKAAPPP